jgi:YidC/Oxa1 family membrane protein insertase
MFDTLLVRPVFNLLEFIYALIPGHDLGVAIILFTIVVRLCLWPLVRKQLHHAQAMRKLQPELKKLKKAAAGDRQKEARLQMELYKERGIRPFSSIGTLLIQIPVFIALYQAILKITNDPSSLNNFAYGWVGDLPWIQTLAADISKFDETFFGLVDLSRKGIESGGIYFPAVVVAGVSTFMQYHQTKLMMHSAQDARKLSEILKDAASGKEADQAEVTAAVSKIMLFILPFATFIFALIVPSALSLYLLTSSAVGYLQQRRVLAEDSEEMHQIASEGTANDTPVKTVVTVTDTSKKAAATKKKTSKAKTSKTAAKKKRRR